MSGSEQALTEDRTLDAKGLYCPEPVMMLHAEIDEMGAGQLLKLIATDPSTQRDVPKFCQFLGHELISQGEEGDLYIYWIRVKSA